MFRKHMPLPVVVFVLALVLAAGCRKQAVHDYEAQPMPQISAKLTEVKVKDAIVRAGTAAGWQVVPEEGPSLRATTYYRNKHMAAVRITFTQNTYSIRYANSANFDYNGGMIHSNYNNLVLRLRQSIDAELASIR